MTQSPIDSSSDELRAGASRRQVLRAAGVATALGATSAIAGASARQDEDPPTLRLGLVGCGGRGGGAVRDALRADPNTKLVAMGDAFDDRISSKLAELNAEEEFKGRIDVPSERAFAGFDCHEKVTDNCDVVLMASTPHFRPAQVEYAVKAGKHMFVEKPVATDAPGLRRIWAACDEAKEKNLAVVSGLCYRYQNAKRATIEKIREGAIGDIKAIECSYDTGGLWHRGQKPEWSEMETQLRNWLYYTWLSGDHIVEQHVHNLDAINWAFQSPPTEVFGVGGRQSRTSDEYGHIFDHFGLEYRYPDDRFAMSMCRQQAGTDGRVEEVITGADGTATLTSGRAVLTGPNAWRFKGPQRSPYVQEHMDLQASIRGTGDYLNEGQRIAESTLTAIMGREAAYTGKVITFEEALNSDQDLMPDLADFTDMPTPPVPIPGQTRMNRSDDVRPTDA